MTDAYFIGIDVGTSGVRAALINNRGKLVRSVKSALDDHGSNRRDPRCWWSATDTVLTQLAIDLPVKAICVDATSGTVLPIDEAGKPLSDALMYNDPINDKAVLETIAAVAPATSAVHGASSALARAIVLQRTSGACRVVHQADWIAGKLTSRFDISDESNALKTGYDAVNRCWPAWLAEAGMDCGMLPSVFPAGTITSQITPQAAAKYNVPAEAKMVAGVSDGCASFLATGAVDIGDCVTSLGSTITMKMLCDRPLYSAQYGVYSHRIGDRWLAGGASNSGGNVLASYFTDSEIESLSTTIEPGREAPYPYYPLLTAGERFPHNDVQWQPVMTPRPQRDDQFLHCLLSGMSCIEALGYQRLQELGAPAINSMRTVGGGAKNTVWTKIRQRHIDADFRESVATEAAVGVALLARDACAG